MSVFRSTDDQMYEIAVSLAKTYHVPLWDVYMIHLEFLFDENESQYVLALLLWISIACSYVKVNCNY